MKSYPIKIIAPNGTLLEKDIVSLRAVGEGGVFNVLADHAPIVAKLSKAPFHVTGADGQELTFHFDDGFLRAADNSVVVSVFRKG